jgi:hypothetical protein
LALEASTPTDTLELSESKGASGLYFTPANPQLLEGAWNASAPRLSELIADYKLIADLATVYGRL